MTTFINQMVGRRIRTCRRDRNYSQEELAKLLHISQNLLSKIELGKISITVDRLVQIAEVLDVDIAVFVAKMAYDIN